MDGGVGEEGHVGGELAPDPESRQEKEKFVIFVKGLHISIKACSHVRQKHIKHDL